MDNDRGTGGETNKLGNMLTLPVFKTFSIMGKTGKSIWKIYLWKQKQGKNHKESMVGYFWDIIHIPPTGIAMATWKCFRDTGW